MSGPDDKGPKDAAARLADARARKAERDAAAAMRAEAKELADLEAEDAFESALPAVLEKEGLAPDARGIDFIVVDVRDHAEGFIVVKLGANVLHKRFMAAVAKADKKDQPPSPEDVGQYVTPCVIYPEREKYLAIVDRRPRVANRCANALLTLHGSQKEAEAGKY